MPQFNCPFCSNPFTAPAGASAVKVLCPHCRQAVEIPAAAAARWFLARNKKKYGPYTWPQLRSLVERGQLRPQDMVLREGEKQWARAETLPELFANVPAPPVHGVSELPAAPPTPDSAKSPGRPFPWMLAGLGGGGLVVVLGLCLIAGYFMLPKGDPAEPKPPGRDHVVENKKKKEVPPTPKTDDSAKKELPKKKPPDKKPIEKLGEATPAQFVESLNELRKAAGLGVVVLDPDLSRGCQAHAKYLAANVDPNTADLKAVAQEDPNKPAYDEEGARVARLALISLQMPQAALRWWMSRLAGRTALLNPELHSVGVGFVKERGTGYCVVDVARGRGEGIIVYPSPRHIDIPISFSGGPEVPDAKAAGGFPISVTFPRTKQVRAAQIELRDPKGKALEGWTWTPEKAPPAGRKKNMLVFVAKGMLLSDTTYQVQASADVDGKPWRLDWSFTTEDDRDSKGIWAAKALAKVNAFRTRAGLEPVTLDESFQKGCLAHARYLVINEGHPSLQGLKAHEEDLTLPGSSQEGHLSGKASNIAIGDYEPIDGLDSWMATLYHRVPILEPRLKRIGFGCARGRRQGWVTLLNVNSGRDKGPRPHAVFYPVPDQVDVPLSFPNGGEEPNPIPDDKDGRAGYPITATFTPAQPLKGATGKLINEKGIEVPCWFSSPEQVANARFAKYQGQTVCLIAKDPLVPNTTYEVHLQGMLAGKAWEKKWKFKTADAGLSAQTATRAVVDRLNDCRLQAGLNAVVLDVKLSRGCQLHAEYLVKNADALAKMKASVNTEDPQLPWFTAEGLRSAQQSFVFTHAPRPVFQIDDLMATGYSRSVLLDPSLQRIGYGCSHDIGRGWRCVLDINGGRGDGRVLYYPGANQTGVPTISQDSIPEAKGAAGFPISITFPPRAGIQKLQAVLVDEAKGNVNLKLVGPDETAKPKNPRITVGIYPLAPLRAGHTYTITVSAIVNAEEWRETWRFTTGTR